MNSVKCIVCRQILPTLKTLQNHLLRAHSKIELVKAISKLSSSKNQNENSTQASNGGDKKKDKKKRKSRKSCLVAQENVNETNQKCEQVYFIAVDENSNECKKHLMELSHESPPLKFINDNTKLLLQFGTNTDNLNLLKLGTEKPSAENICSTCSPLTSTTDLSDTERRSFSGIKQLKQSLRRENIETLKTFRKDKAIGETSSLNERSGTFYVCHCMKMEESDKYLNLLNSDTDTCSEREKQMTSPNFNSLFYCNSCGNGYSSKEKLLQHIHVHSFKCNFCRCMFSYEEEYMSHLQNHLIRIFVCHYCHQEFGHKQVLVQHLDEHFENEFYDNILALEEEYRVSTYNRHLFDGYNNNFYVYERPESLNKYSFCCDLCRITFYNFNDYQLHWRSHNSFQN